jgi:predicted nucleic acid-binding protein
MTLEFVDTNILIYAYDPGAGQRHELTRELVAKLAQQRSAAISVQVLQEFYVAATRKTGVAMPTADALARLEAFTTWTIHQPRPADVIAAARIAQDNTLSFWDAMIVRSAQALGCSTLWSEDLNPGQMIAGVTVSNPFQS